MKLTEIKGNIFENTNSDTVYAHCIVQDDNYEAGIAPVFVKFSFYVIIEWLVVLFITSSKINNIYGFYCILLSKTAYIV